MTSRPIPTGRQGSYQPLDGLPGTSARTPPTQHVGPNIDKEKQEAGAIPRSRTALPWWKKLCCPEEAHLTEQTEIQEKHSIAIQAEGNASQGKPSPTGKWLLSNRTPLDQLPFKSWRDFRDAYRSNQMDLNDPPLPPSRGLSANEEEEDAYEKQNLLAPHSINETERLAALRRLDAYGREATRARHHLKKAERQSPHVQDSEYEQLARQEPRPTAENEFSESLEGHPEFKRIVSFARQNFGTKMSMISVIEDDTLMYLAETGLGMESVPRDIIFCAHTILGAHDGMVVKDSHQDWRFAQNAIVRNYGTRFYAGVPVLAPPMRDGAEQMPIGTVCICDDQPRKVFTDAERKKLQHLAALASAEIATWHQTRMRQKNAALARGLTKFHRRIANDPRKVQQTPENERSILLLDDDEYETTTEGDHIIEMTAEDDPASRRAKVFALATRMMAQTMALPLIYLIQMNLDGPTLTSMQLISSFGLPDPIPDFDPELHSKALFSPQGGLLYQNPEAPKEEQEDVYASAILVRVCQSGKKGFILAAFATSHKRIMGLEDLDYMRDMGKELEPYCLEL